jgi:hypothetical protein
MTILAAVKQALSGKNWLTESELRVAVWILAGRKISGSNATARCREIKAQCRHLSGRRWEYHI